MLFAFFSIFKFIFSAKLLECNANNYKFLLNIFLYENYAKY